MALVIYILWSVDSIGAAMPSVAWYKEHLEAYITDPIHPHGRNITAFVRFVPKIVLNIYIEELKDNDQHKQRNKRFVGFMMTVFGITFPREGTTSDVMIPS